MARVSIFDTPLSILSYAGSHDIYIMDMDTPEALSIGIHMKEVDTGSYCIYTSADINKAYDVIRKAKARYFLEKPYIAEDVISMLREVRRKIQNDNIIIKIPGGERRVRINYLNYINIVKRCLCYHLQDGTMFDGQTLRSSFEKAIYPLQENKSFIFIAPSLLINVGQIKILNGDNAVFENDDVVYFPKKSYEMIHDAWKTYNKII